MNTKTIQLQYFALLREQRGLSEETLSTSADTAADLYQELQAKHNFTLETQQLKVAINDEFADFETVLQDGDTLIFIPPVAGG